MTPKLPVLRSQSNGILLITVNPEVILCSVCKAGHTPKIPFSRNSIETHTTQGSITSELPTIQPNGG
jgi:hypothetical protein